MNVVWRGQLLYLCQFGIAAMAVTATEPYQDFLWGMSKLCVHCYCVCDLCCGASDKLIAFQVSRRLFHRGANTEVLCHH